MKSHPSPLRLQVSLLLVALALVLGSCVSDTDFLIQKTSDADKAAMLVQKGAEAYAAMAERTDVKSIPDVRNYFEVALRFDPHSAEAKRFMARVDNFRDTQYGTAMAELNRLVDRKDRKEADDYRMGVLVQRVSLLKPNSEEVRKIVSRAEKSVRALVENYNSRTANVLQRLEKENDDKRREAMVLEGLASANRAVEIAPGNGTSQGNLASLKTAAKALADKHVAGAEPLVAKYSFTAARARLDAAATLSRQFGGAFDGDIKGAYFRLYYAWARYLTFEAKEYAAAARRIDAAFDYGNSPEARDLQARIARAQKAGAAAVAANPAGAAVSFDVIQREIDQLITEKNYPQAMRAISEAQSSGVWPDKQAVLAERRSKVMAQVAAFYEQGVTAYREERFADAIKLFVQVERIAGPYEQSSDYLQKSRDKQKVLDQY